MTTPGSYALLIYLPTTTCIAIGRLGVVPLPDGYYVYCGSALGGIQGRIRRYLRREKRLHWHVDHLLAQARLVQAWVAPGNERLECRWTRLASELPGARLAVAGFGSSDCRCPGHLVYWGTEDPAQMRRTFQTLTGSHVWPLHPELVLHRQEHPMC